MRGTLPAANAWVEWATGSDRFADEARSGADPVGDSLGEPDRRLASEGNYDLAF
jgi:hypothetical protein